MFEIRPYQLELAKLCKRYGVRELALFGSALRDDFDVVHSDLDFVVDFAFQESESYAIAYFEFIEQLEALLGYPVDIISQDALRNTYLNLPRLEQDLRQLVDVSYED